MAGWDLLLCFGSFCLTAEMFHLLGLLRKSIECWQSLEGKLKTAFLLIWKYSAPQLICVFTPNVSFVSYKARGSSRINESQYFYNIQRFSWESPRFTDGWNSTTWFVWVCFVVFFNFYFFFPLWCYQNRKLHANFGELSAECRDLTLYLQGFQGNSWLLNTHKVPCAAWQDFGNFPLSHGRLLCSIPSTGAAFPWSAEDGKSVFYSQFWPILPPKIWFFSWIYSPAHN